MNTTAYLIAFVQDGRVVDAGIFSEFPVEQHGPESLSQRLVCKHKSIDYARAYEIAKAHVVAKHRDLMGMRSMRAQFARDAEMATNPAAWVVVGKGLSR